ncbi:MAG: hypothetical protein COA84_05990 [Robiginitomaculum sp.]|nr:MAG: hypothetical protein COA84_05990 [Robiginitomaculum sp.]
MDITVKTVADLSGAECEAWQAFQAADPDLHSPYFSLGFARACAAVRQNVRVAIVRNNHAIKAFLPFHRRPLGYSLPLGGPLGDFHGLIAEPGLALNLRQIMRAARMSVYPFEFVPAAQSSFTSVVREQKDCHVADLCQGYDHWYEDRMAAHKKSLKKYEAKARKLGKEHGELQFTGDDRDPAAFAKLLAWKSAQYHATGFFDVFSVPWTGALLKTIHQSKDDAFAGQLSTLRAGKTLVAAHFGMKSAGAAHYWFPAYDPDFSLYSPGHTLMFKLLQYHAGAEVQQVHLGVGDFRYKHQFGGQMLSLCSGTAMAPSFAAGLRQCAQGVQNGFEALPLGPVSRLPGRVLRRMDRMMAFRPA